MTVTASLVKELRERSGAGMMDCKKALVETNGNFEEAVDWLRTKGLAAAAKKAGRVAAEGLTAVAIHGNKAAAIEINSETDFVSRNQAFQALVNNVAEIAVDAEDLEELQAMQMPTGRSVEDEIIANVATIGENLSLRRMKALEVSDGAIASYIHNSVTDNMGKIAVLVALESSGDKQVLAEVGKQIAMHIAAAKPQSLTADNIDPALIQREKDVFTEQSKDSGKPADIIEKMVEGRIRKFLEEVVLMDQTFVIDGKTKISMVLAETSAKLGTTVTLKDYVRFELGEGVEKEVTNFADEVAAVTAR